MSNISIKVSLKKINCVWNTENKYFMLFEFSMPNIFGLVNGKFKSIVKFLIAYKSNLYP